ncbi:flavin-binding monooxygenase [Ganoderma leucocontextum]|nr:flavin-binding monooxygenase [Ganoderma leucocontextum]
MADSAFVLGQFSVDEHKPIRVVVIGAGMGGILAAIRFPQKIPNVKLTVYEKNAGVGGTWFTTRYPGVACDSPSHSYQYSFEDKRDWSAFYSPGHEIQQNLEQVAQKYNAMQYIKLNHEVVRAEYDAPSGQWCIRVRRTDLDTGVHDEIDEIDDVADVLITAFGSVSRWKMPDIEGVDEFKGELHHSAGYRPKGKTWHEDADAWGDKRVGVIGSIVTELQPKVAKVVNYVRGQTWITPPVGLEPLLQVLGREPTGQENALVFTPEEVERFKTDSEFFWRARRAVDASLNSWNDATILGSPLQVRLRENLTKSMQSRLSARPDIAEKLIPNFPVCGKRLGPGPGYLKALCKDNVDFVSSPIKRFTESGIETEDGARRDLDIVFCATGYDMSWQLPFPIIGRGGLALNEKWKDYPVSYLSLCTDGFPNMFMVMGPNSVIGVGPFIRVIKVGVAYAVQAVAKMQRERLKSIEVKGGAVRDFDELLQEYFKKTAFGVGCRSWYKLGEDTGRVFGEWPGSVLHALRTLEHPRWEDFKYKHSDQGRNRLYWLGDGQTSDEKSEWGDRAWYLSEEYTDRPPVHDTDPTSLDL